MFYYLLFSILWIIALFMTINQFVTKCTAVIWYFSGQGSDQDDKATPVSVSKGLWWSFRYHFGTLAFGSFLVALVTFLRIIFEIFCKKFEEAGEKAGPIWKIVACCVRCCLWCLECCVKVITENAYVHCAINGTNFCTSAHSAFYTAVRYPGLFAAANIVGNSARELANNYKNSSIIKCIQYSRGMGKVRLLCKPPFPNTKNVKMKIK